ncbi:MAG: thiamine-phosphate kinase [Zoogloeaceae bacterium]|jgi:thiamine-monophosphate kinase|nr:thiamine-phosphate kinase [Zoogloeaceae bacterium]
MTPTLNEEPLIERLCRLMPRAPEQVNRVFEADAEILAPSRLGNAHLLFSTDEFSAEDCFLMQDAHALGRNIACAALSDLLACGGRPLYYAHSLTIDTRFDGAYLTRFYEGVAEMLAQAGAYFIGGDFGRARDWRCAVSVIGYAEKPILRSGARAGDYLYITGPVGAGNLQAALALHDLPESSFSAPDFTLRIAALPDIAAHATSCIDTSDGLFNAACALARLSDCGFALENIPYLPSGKALAQRLGLPLSMLAFCECGEYELLFTSPAELPCHNYHRIGRVTQSGRTFDGKDVAGFSARARAHADRQSYFAEMRRQCAGL